MKLFGLCSFYDESPTWLAAHVAASARLVDHLVFVDGAYVLFDKDGRSSGVEAHDAIARACHAAGIGFTLHVPETPWLGNEVEKRAFMFRLAESLSTEDDWYVVIDADTVYTDGDREIVRQVLAETELDAFNVRLLERYDWNTGPDGALIVPRDGSGTPSVTDSPLTCVFRAIRGLTVRGAHYLFVHPDPDARYGWRALWGPATEYDVAPAGDLEISFEHWSRFRPKDRRDAAQTYYQRRDSLRLERTTRQAIETIDGDVAEI